MKKYWYFTYKVGTKNGHIFGVGKCSFEDGEFDIADVIDHLMDEFKTENVAVDSWHEISTKQYEKMQKFFDKTKK